MPLSLYNTLTRRKDILKPLDAGNVRMYVCGPTVYDRPHIGNARSAVIYDVLYRVLSHLYPKVTYVRNITDVDDKINAAAKQNGEPISALTKRVEGWFHDDMAQLGCLNPTHEPHATGHIKEMIALIESLLKHNHAYVAQKHVLFRVNSYAEYGALSGRKLDDLIAGARVEVESYKEHPGDFVLWKPAEEGDDPSSVFDSPWGAGRPGWHIECSAMSNRYLGDHFDIHGGGADLMFPHHENEIAQSRCALPGSKFANVWVHNGFLTVNGEKMSKSLGNFITVRDLLDKGVHGEVIRFALLSAKYSEPLDWNEKLLHDAKLTLDKWYRIANSAGGKVPEAFIASLSDDLNLPKAFSLMHAAKPDELLAMGKLLGFFGQTYDGWFKGITAHVNITEEDDSMSGSGTVADPIQAKIDARIEAKKSKNWAEADRIRKELSDKGIILEDRPDGTTDWRRA